MEKKFEKILHVLGELALESSRGTPIIVEGRKDVEALGELGICGAAITVKTGGKSLPDLLQEVQEMGKDEVILMMDFDRRGRELTGRLMRGLEEMRIKPNMTFWKELLGIVKSDVKDIEGLATYLKTLGGKVGKV